MVAEGVGCQYVKKEERERETERGEKAGGVLQGRVEGEKKRVGEERRDTIEELNPTVE